MKNIKLVRLTSGEEILVNVIHDMPMSITVTDPVLLIPDAGKIGFVTTDHQEQAAVAGLRDAGRHTGFEAGSTGGLGSGVDLAVDGRCERGAVDERASGSTGEEVVFAEVDRFHGGVVGYDREHDIGPRCDLGQGGASGCTDFGGEAGGHFGIEVEDGGDVVAFVIEAAGHVAAHAAEADESDFLIFHNLRELKGKGRSAYSRRGLGIFRLAQK